MDIASANSLINSNDLNALLDATVTDTSDSASDSETSAHDFYDEFVEDPSYNGMTPPLPVCSLAGRIFWTMSRTMQRTMGTQ